MAGTAIAATNGEAIDAAKLLNIRELEEHGLKPGDAVCLRGSLMAEIKVPAIPGAGTKLSVGRHEIIGRAMV